MASDLSISSLVREKSPISHTKLLAVKREVLGPRYTLSVALIGASRSQTLNRRLRKKNRPANVLSLPLGSGEGEILITPDEARRSAKTFKEAYPKHILRLFIHGCLHLKGHPHGHTMEKAEERLLKKFSA